MDDMISRAAAISEIDEYLQGLDSCISEPDLKLDGYKNGLQVAIQELKALPAVDAVPVIRCLDCLYFCDMSDMGKTDQCSYHSVLGPDGELENIFYTTPEAYCAWGERRDDDGTDA